MKLSERQLQILDLLRKGMTNKEIGQAIGVSPHNIRDCISGMLRQFRVNGRTALVAAYLAYTNPSQVSVLAERRNLSDRRTPPSGSSERLAV